MTSSKLRVTFLELFVEEYRKIELTGRSVFLSQEFSIPHNEYIPKCEVVRSFIAILGHQTDYKIMQFLKSAKF